MRNIAPMEEAPERTPVLENARGELAIVFPAGRSPGQAVGELGPLRLAVDKRDGSLRRADGEHTGFAVASNALALFAHPRRCMALEADNDGRPSFVRWLALA